MQFELLYRNASWPSKIRFGPNLQSSEQDTTQRVLLQPTSDRFPQFLFCYPIDPYYDKHDTCQLFTKNNPSEVYFTLMSALPLCFHGSTDLLFLIASIAGKGLRLSAASLKNNIIHLSFEYLKLLFDKILTSTGNISAYCIRTLRTMSGLMQPKVDVGRADVHWQMNGAMHFQSLVFPNLQVKEGLQVKIVAYWLKGW